MMRRSLLPRRYCYYTSCFSTTASTAAAAGGRQQVVGVVREAYGIWERRAPLSPAHVQQLVSLGWRVQVQPSSRRIYQDAEYRAAGAEMTEDLGESTVVLGVKQVPIENLLPDRAYMFFSHTIKAQKENMPLLDACLEKNIRLYDYECIERDDKRLVAFGQYAGIVGMADILQGLGQRLLADGYSTPLLQAPLCYMQPSLPAVEERITAIGERIKNEGLPPGLGPLVFAFTGGGNVAKGAKRIFELLPFKMIAAEELPSKVAALEADVKAGQRQHTLFGVYLDSRHLVRKKRSSGAASPLDGDAGFCDFNKRDYYANPASYESVFHETVAPYISVFVNGMYWDPRFPRLLTIDQLQHIATTSEDQGSRQQQRRRRPPRLRAIADVTCDIDGSLEMSTRATTFEQPYFEWDAARGREAAAVGTTRTGVVVSTVDILPTGLAQEATEHFGTALLPILENCLQHGIPDELRTACITDAGTLQERFKFIAMLRAQNEKAEERLLQKEAEEASAAAGESRLLKPPGSRRVVLAQGHLFDSHFINEAFDEIEKRGHFEILNFFVVPNIADTQKESQMTLAITADTDEDLEALHGELEALGSRLGVRLHAPSHETFHGGGTLQSKGEMGNMALLGPFGGPFDGPLGSLGSSAAEPTAFWKAGRPKRVLLLGAGLVAAPLVEYLTRPERETATTRRRHVTIASDSSAAAQQLSARAPGASTAVELTIDDLARCVQSRVSSVECRMSSRGRIILSCLSNQHTSFCCCCCCCCLFFAINFSIGRTIRRTVGDSMPSSRRRTSW